jgi:pyridoxal phosphate enzyme (YggS family)
MKPIDHSYYHQPDTIHKNYTDIVARINRSALDCSRDPKEILLVVVTKTHSVETIQYLQDAGATHLGENYVDEAIPKIESLKNYPNLKWHMIGHVQSRKAKDVCEYFSYVHSVDSVKIAERLNRFAEIFEKSLPVWLEFNIGGEGSKSGWDISDRDAWGLTLPDIDEILQLSNLYILGLMTIPPYLDDAENARQFYKHLRQYRDYLHEHFSSISFHELSMGMSSDFEVAIQEGSTCVRIGQAILGPREFIEKRHDD